ncbi:hypothetical protein [Plantactinospora sp. KLBMP9567]|uniref:hypothetical protein n=1 Tax=unclassified Plantactinospora TaxID=2631981 RepID=UPI002982429F|nr:hypothetical protein [Plantactinospora sp. KLBMP9567]MDW5323753.1 hypothetical protein [Plantactinospora sp. KLBMP9567]MDW5326873.1 hypothetical protein [Plantactinospora sp. KLBMP9567]
MRAATGPGGERRRREHRPVLAEFRLTWRQAVVRGLRWGGLGSGAVIVIASALPGHRELSELVWVAVLAPLPLGVLCGAADRLRARVRLDEAGLRGRAYGGYAFVAWQRVVDVRAERRRGRTVVAVYLGDAGPLRLHAPYDGGPLDRDPRFEQKLVLICQVWEAHRHGSREREARPLA